MAPLRYAAKFDPFLSLDCAPHPPPWRNPRKGRDQILPSGNLDEGRKDMRTELKAQGQENGKEGRKEQRRPISDEGEAEVEVERGP